MRFGFSHVLLAFVAACGASSPTPTREPTSQPNDVQVIAPETHLALGHAERSAAPVAALASFERACPEIEEACALALELRLSAPEVAWNLDATAALVATPDRAALEAQRLEQACPTAPCPSVWAELITASNAEVATRAARDAGRACVEDAAHCAPLCALPDVYQDRLRAECEANNQATASCAVLGRLHDGGCPTTSHSCALRYYGFHCAKYGFRTDRPTSLGCVDYVRLWRQPPEDDACEPLPPWAEIAVARDARRLGELYDSATDDELPALVRQGIPGLPALLPDGTFVVAPADDHQASLRADFVRGRRVLTRTPPRDDLGALRAYAEGLTSALAGAVPLMEVAEGRSTSGLSLTDGALRLGEEVVHTMRYDNRATCGMGYGAAYHPETGRVVLWSYADGMTLGDGPPCPSIRATYETTTIDPARLPPATH